MPRPVVHEADEALGLAELSQHRPRDLDVLERLAGDLAEGGVAAGIGQDVERALQCWTIIRLTITNRAKVA